MRTFLIADPAKTREAARCGHPLAHASYRIGKHSALLRQNQPMQPRGGLLWVSDRDAPAAERTEALCAAVLRECARQNYGGAVLDFEAPIREDLRAFARRLGTRLAERDLALYLPESYGADVPEAYVLIGTALSGGNFRERLEEAAARFGGAQRLALDAERLRMDFPLPCPAGIGTPLSTQEFQTLLERERPVTFFSADLCARYFTYRREGRYRFVLYDDADTLREKLRIGAELGISTAFFCWPEVEDLAGALFAAPLP